MPLPSTSISAPPGSLLKVTSEVATAARVSVAPTKAVFPAVTSTERFSSRYPVLMNVIWCGPGASRLAKKGVFIEGSPWPSISIAAPSGFENNFRSPVPDAAVLGGWPDVAGASFLGAATTGAAATLFFAPPLAPAGDFAAVGFSGLGAAGFSGAVVGVAVIFTAGVTGWSWAVITLFQIPNDAAATSAIN